MPKCVLCGELHAPMLSKLTEDGKAHKCVFCERGVDSIKYEKDGQNKELTRKEAKDEYFQYVNKLVRDNTTIRGIVKGMTEE